jgi:outer membrane protein insertion porin family
MTSEAVADNMKNTIRELRNGLPSAAAGLGLVYAHPLARFELNFTLPLVMRKDEQARKGLQFGVGITFL